MARLRGSPVDIDLTTPFAVESGGRVYDLSDKLHFEVKWDGSSIQERFTGDILTGSGHTSTPGPGSHTGFLVNNTGSFENLVPNISWANDEFTLSFWAKFSDINITTGSNGNIRQFDFLLSKNNVSSTPKFSTVLMRDEETTTGLRSYFGIYNFDCGGTDLLSNFCDTNENSRIILNPPRDLSNEYDHMYPSENSRDGTISLDRWSHIVLRSSTRKNGKNGICDVWVDGKRVHRTIQRYQNTAAEGPYEYIPAGSGVCGENQLKIGGKIIVYEFPPVSISLDYPSYLASENDRLFLSNHSFYQVAKWDRVLRDDEILAIYRGTLSGVYTQRKTSISSPPRKKALENLSFSESKNYGYTDAEKKETTPFNDSTTIFGSYNVYLGKNVIKNNFIDECHLEMSGSVRSSILQLSNQSSVKISEIRSFNDAAKSNFVSQDGSVSTSVVTIPIFSTDRNDNLQYAGRTDSRLSRRYSTLSSLNLFSMFLSSSLYRHGRIDESYTKVDSGISGTGFLYYSPSKRCWVEKRSQNENSRGVNTLSIDVTSAVNAIEVNSWTHPDGDGGFLGVSQSGRESIRDVAAAYPEDDQNWYLSKLQVTGANQIMRQFTASPQLAYFTNNKSDLINAGYESIGSPTVAFGAPFAPRYHAYDNETIKMKSFIDAPFLLKKAILKIPVEIQRINEDNASGYETYYSPVAYFNFESASLSPATVEDFSGNNHIATLVNSASVTLSSTPGNISGRGKLSLANNASSTADIDNMTITHASDLSISSSGICISMWVSFKQQNTQFLFAKSSASGNDTEYYALYDNSLDRITFRISDQSASSYSTDFIGRSVNNVSNFISDDDWHHIVFMYDGVSTSHTAIKIYINGTKRDNLGGTSGTFTSPRSSTMNITVGSRGNSFSDDYRGSIASLMFWNRELDEDEVSALYTSGLNSSRYKWDWTTNITHRKDLDNYVFFLYRQRRASTDAVIDSLNDVSSSSRFLIGSGSLCVYNSSSFGLSRNDGFIDIFGVNTPIDTSYSIGTARSTTLNDMFRSSSNGVDPITNITTEKVHAPIHGPSLSINSGIESGSFIYRGFIEVEINPAYVLGGFPNNTLLYITSSKGHMSTSFYSLTRDPYDPDFTSFNPDKCNRLFNWYPQKGSNEDVFNKSVTPPITSIFQNMWFGGTRQPTIAVDSYPQYQLQKSEYTASIQPYFQFNNKGYTKTQYSELQNAYGGGTTPLFDIELARTGFSIFTTDKSPFNTNVRLVNDGRGIASSFSRFANLSLAGVFQRTQTITIEDFTGETSNNKNGEFSVLPGISGSSFSDILSSMTVGYSPISNNQERNFYNPYILLPEDEIVLGLDAGITPPPDVAPYIGENLPDSNESGQHRPPQKAFINPVLKEKIWHYAGNSYLRILPGEADLVLYGDYLREGKPFERNRSIPSNNVSQIVGNDPVTDQFENAETDAYVGTYLSEIIAGSITQGTRGVTGDNSIQGLTNIHSLKRHVSLFNEHIILADPYVSGVM